MRILYDEEHDVLDVIFKVSDHTTKTTGYELRDGIILYTNENMLPLQLTLVNFRRLTRVPVVHFDHLANHPEDVRKDLLTLAAKSPLTAFLRVDANTFYGHIMSPTLLDVCYQ